MAKIRRAFPDDAAKFACAHDTHVDPRNGHPQDRIALPLPIEGAGACNGRRVCPGADGMSFHRVPD